MGIFDSIKGLIPAAEQKKSSVPFVLNTYFTPFRLTAKKNDNVDLHVDLENVYGADALCSVSVKVQRGLGTDSTLLNREKTYKLETVRNGEKKHVSAQIFSASSTQPGMYKISIEAYTHFRDYRHIENAVKKIVEIRVV
ncbi:MAG TPA: hypothetical protein PLO51_00280 [Candidatus Micrarchaeota archaeon]|nr:hypothetical protein [Candidatus Micrarchaeota archaeon]